MQYPNSARDRTTDTPTEFPHNANMSFNDVSMMSQSLHKKKKTLDDYEIIESNRDTKPDLGRGTFSNVKLVRDKGNQRKQFAMKILNKKQLKASIKSEIKIQKKLNHPHIIKLIEYFEDKENVYLILEYAQRGTLRDYLKKKKKIPENEAFIFFFQTCVALDYMHKKNVIHRDLKPENMLLADPGDIKLSDFGMSAEDVGQRNSFCGTTDYMAPEMVQKRPHDAKVDIWSLGIVLYEMLHGSSPFTKETNEETLAAIIRNEVEFGNISTDAKDLLSSLLKSNSDERLSVLSIFTHPWMQKHQRDFKIDYTKYIYNPNKNIESTENRKADTPALTSSQSQGLFLSQTSEVMNPFMNNSGSQKNTPRQEGFDGRPSDPFSNRTKSTPNIYQPFSSSPLQKERNDFQALSASVEKPAKSFQVEENVRKTSPGVFGQKPTSSSQQVDVNGYLKQYGLDETDEIKVLNKLDAFYTKGSVDHGNQPLESKDQNRLEGSKRNTKENNLEMSFQDRMRGYLEEDHLESRIEDETFGGNTSRGERLLKSKQAESGIRTQETEIQKESQVPKKSLNKQGTFGTENEGTTEQAPVGNEEGRVSSTKRLTASQEIPKNEQNVSRRTHSYGNWKGAQEVRPMTPEEEREEYNDFERKSQALLKNYKVMMGNISLSQSNNFGEHGMNKTNEESPVKQVRKTMENGGGVKREKETRHMEDRNAPFESSPQKKFEKERMLENPEFAKDWLNRKTPDKDLDYSFMPRSLAYNFKTMDQSMSELRKKTQELETVIGDRDIIPERVSRSSWKNIQDRPTVQPQEESGGLFSKFLAMIGCVERDNKGRPLNSMQNHKKR